MLLTREQYDISYFDGKIADYMHNAGYSFYEDGDGFKEAARFLVEDGNLIGKKVLEIGCAKGFLLKGLLDLGVKDIQGVDFSKYAIEKAESSIKDKIIYSDALAYLKTLDDSYFDVIIVRHVFECLTDQYAINLVNEINRVSFKSMVIFIDANSKYYNSKNIQEWMALCNWKKESYFRYGLNNKPVII